MKIDYNNIVNSLLLMAITTFIVNGVHIWKNQALIESYLLEHKKNSEDLSEKLDNLIILSEVDKEKENSQNKRIIENSENIEKIRKEQKKEFEKINNKLDDLKKA